MILVDHFRAGGWAMWLILVWLVAVGFVFIEKTVYLFMAHQEIGVFTAAVTKLVESGKWKRASVLAGSARTPLGRITQAGLEKAEGGPGAVQRAMDEVALRELPALRRRVDFLAFFANLAMLCGLFGTIVGLIKAFGSVGAASIDLSQKSRILAEGIAEAMNCTAFGLVTAILALVAFAVISTWVTHIEDCIHSETVKIINAVVARHERI